MPFNKAKGRSKNNQLGRSILKSYKHIRRGAKKSEAEDYNFPVPEPEDTGLKSVLDVNSLDDFLHTAKMADRDFEAERHAVIVVNGATMKERASAGMEVTDELRHIKIPRRPKWTTSDNKTTLDRKEKDAFLKWRRDIARQEETSSNIFEVTPFEKNIEVWRQLWRVVERSDVVAQVVDARNPELYRCRDLMRYVAEVDPLKQNILLINKADFLTLEQREAWAKYYSDAGITFIFVSAKVEQDKLDNAAKEQRDRDAETAKEDIIERLMQDLKPMKDEDNNNEEEEEEEEYSVSADEIVIKEVVELTEEERVAKEFSEKCRILDRIELLKYFESHYETYKLNVVESPSKESFDKQVVVGMVGFPNVGKSSVINVLIGAAKHVHGQNRVGVGATPGKTKHFQTLILSDELMLCDCPGLVFPSFVKTKSDMVISGVLPIAQLRDHHTPVAAIVKLLPRHIFEETYGLTLPVSVELKANAPVHARTLLQYYCVARGFTASNHSGPDESRGARNIITDFVKGKLLYVHMPPTDSSLKSLTRTLINNTASDDFIPFTETTTTAEIDNSNDDLEVSDLIDAGSIYDCAVTMDIPLGQPGAAGGRHQPRERNRGPRNIKAGKKDHRRKNPYEDYESSSASSLLSNRDKVGARVKGKKYDGRGAKMLGGKAGKMNVKGTTFTRVQHPYKPSIVAPIVKD